MKDTPLLERLGVAYEVLDDDRVLAVFMPNQSFLMTMDYRARMLKDSNEWNKNWFVIKTTASAASWDDWAVAHPEDFCLLFSNSLSRIYKVLNNHS